MHMEHMEVMEDQGWWRAQPPSWMTTYLNHIFKPQSTIPTIHKCDGSHINYVYCKINDAVNLGIIHKITMNGPVDLRFQKFVNENFTGLISLGFAQINFIYYQG